MKLIKLTSSENNVVLVNFQNVSHLAEGEECSIIYTTKNEGYHTITVKESLDEIVEMLESK